MKLGHPSDVSRVSGVAAECFGKFGSWLMKRCLYIAAFLLLLASGCRGSDHGTADADPVPDDAGAAHAPTARSSDIELRIDLDAGTIAGVSWRTPVEELRSRFGTENVRKEVRLLEGMPDTLYVISIGRHELTKHWNMVSTRDTVFVTANGLGAGSTIAELERVYGPAEMGEGEGDYLRFDSFSVQVPPECVGQGNDGEGAVGINRACRPTAILVRAE